LGPVALPHLVGEYPGDGFAAQQRMSASPLDDGVVSVESEHLVLRHGLCHLVEQTGGERWRNHVNPA
jgi:hypothetical protein